MLSSPQRLLAIIPVLAARFMIFDHANRLRGPRDCLPTHATTMIEATPHERAAVKAHQAFALPRCAGDVSGRSRFSPGIPEVLTMTPEPALLHVRLDQSRVR